MASKTEQYLEEIRALDGLKNAILCGITVGKRDNSAEFFLVTDRTYSVQEEKDARQISEKYLPADFSARVKIVKRVPDAQMVGDKIFAFIGKNFPAAAAFLERENIKVEMLSSGANFCVEIASGEQSLFSSGKILDETSKYLMSGYCGSFYGNVRLVEKEQPDASILEEQVEEVEEATALEIRRFQIENYKKIDGADTYEQLTKAVYIADSHNVEGVYTVCGDVTYIEEIKYVKHNDETGEDTEKTRFSMSINDGSGGLRTTYFPKKATVEKVREIKVGDKIMITGVNEEYKGSKSFKAAKINLGMPPDGFVPEARKSKPVPKFYHTVFPEPYVDYTQSGLFEDHFVPDDLKENVFVCFDLETTGLNNNPAMGRMDRIIELGAVKIVNGEIVEKFSSFVACPERLSKEIINLTGIEDADLVGAPEYEQVLADFYKFCDGALLVGHNVTFDYRFVSYYGEQCGYIFDKKQYDTLHLAQQVLRGKLANYKLNTVADYYGFTFNHHRAFDDACVTAKVFIELVKAKGKLD